MSKNSFVSVARLFGCMAIAAVISACATQSTVPMDTAVTPEPQIEAWKTPDGLAAAGGGMLALKGQGYTSVMYCVPGQDCFLKASQAVPYVRGYTVSTSDECPDGCVRELRGETENRLNVMLTNNVLAVNHQAVVDVRTRTISLMGKDLEFSLPQTGVCVDAAPMRTDDVAKTELCGIDFTWEPARPNDK